MPRVLVLTPDTQGAGGVANYFRTLALPDVAPVEYFFVNRSQRESTFGRVCRLGLNYLKFVNKIRDREVGLVHLNPSFDARSFYRDALFCAIALIFRKRTLVFFRGWDEAFERRVSGSWWRRAIVGNTFGRSGRFVVLGETFEARLRRLGVNGQFWRETTVAGPTPIPKPDVLQKLRESREHLKILFMSRIVRAKGIYLALDAVERLRERHPDKAISLIVAGDGEELSAAKQHVSERGLSFVSFLGEVRGAEKERVLRQSHVLLFPTFHGEGLPNIILEAMLFGLPIVCRDAGAISDVVADGRNGFVTRSESAAEIAGLLERLVSEPRLFQCVSARNATIAGERYVCESVRERLLEIYEQALDDRLTGTRESAR